MSKEEVLSRLRHLCSKNEKCHQDIRDKLNKWDYKGDSEEIIILLEKDNYIDEQRYCDAYICDKIRFSGWGKIKIRYYLKSKRIPEDIINQSLENFPEEEYLEMIQKELVKKSKQLKEKDKFKFRHKIYSFSTQRGFESDIISDMVAKIVDLL